MVGPLEVLRGVALGREDWAVRLAGRGGTAPVRGTFGLSFTPDVTFAPGEADVVVVPGGGWARRAERSVWGEVQRGDWLPLLADAADGGSLMASVCTGAMLLAHAGVIGGRIATTHHLALDDLAATGAHVVAERVVDAGSLVTGAGVTAASTSGSSSSSTRSDRTWRTPQPVAWSTSATPSSSSTTPDRARTARRAVSSARSGGGRCARRDRGRRCEPSPRRTGRSRTRRGWRRSAPGCRTSGW